MARLDEDFIMESGHAHQHKDVTVIGAGWSGLVACKYMLEEGLSVMAIEKRDGIGGVWRYSDDTTIPTVMKSTCCTSSMTFNDMSDNGRACPQTP